MTASPDPRPPRSATGLDPSEGITLAAFVGNGLDRALGQRLSPPRAYAYLDSVEWSYAPASHDGALFGDIGVITGRRCRISLSLTRTTRIFAFVDLDVRRLSGFVRPHPLGPLVITVRQDRITRATWPEAQPLSHLALSHGQSLPPFDAIAEFLVGHLERNLPLRPDRARRPRASRPS